MWLKRFGPGHTVAVLPMAVTGVSLASIFAPGLIALTIGRAIELLLRGSLYRSGYELFYTPMPEAEKRSVKSIIDIGAERLGDGLAGASHPTAARTARPSDLDRDSRIYRGAVRGGNMAGAAAGSSLREGSGKGPGASLR